MNTKDTKTFILATTFLMYYPPLPEIGNEDVCNIIEKFRNDLISKKEALQTIKNKHEKFVTNFIKLTEQNMEYMIY